MSSWISYFFSKGFFYKTAFFIGFFMVFFIVFFFGIGVRIFYYSIVKWEIIFEAFCYFPSLTACYFFSLAILRFVSASFLFASKIRFF